MTGEDVLRLAALREGIRAVPDFPAPGVVFRDLTPLLADRAAFAACIEALASPWRGQDVQAVCGIESRGFIFGAALARELDAGFVPLRKPGKLPPPVVEVDYALEYGTDRLQARNDALRPGQRTLLIDDVLATGGTLCAARALVARLGGALLGAQVVVELDALRGRVRWGEGAPLRALLHF
ncbi:MAG: adenine phosphoribosyltransferase [Fulvimonas sp.]|nr:adenine phosphoribosyltransferase [Fulvimonas sp.]